MRTITLILLCFSLWLTAASNSFAGMETARNFYQYSDKVLTAGQPTQSLLENAAKDGIQVVINVVRPGESIYNEKEADILQKQGIEYIHVPVSWSQPNKEQLQSFLKAMDKVGNRKVLVHCWANARASALVYAHRVSKAPDSASSEFETLRRVWKDIVGIICYSITDFGFFDVYPQIVPGRLSSNRVRV